MPNRGLSPEHLRALERDRFTMVRPLGHGGAATVYLAHDRLLDRQVALKALDPSLALGAGAERFLLEVRRTARLVHPNILPLFDSGSIDGLLFYVMPFVDGETLRQRLDRDGPLPIDQVLAVGRDVAEAIAYAHSQGLVHRDLKPENIFCYHGRALVADFGIATLVSESQPDRITLAGAVVGTAAYMSPEQAIGDPVDGRSDLYSLGCMMFEMIAGRPPFEASNPVALMMRHVTQPAPRVAQLRQETPAGLDRLIDRLLAKNPGQRPANAVELLDELSRLTRPAARPAQPAQGVAVLPFANVTAEPENEYFSDGLTDDLSAALRAMKDIKVAPRGAVFAFKGKQLEPTQIAAALRVAHLVEGSVHRAGNRVRIHVQLVSALGEVLWSDRFDREFQDLFAVQDEIVAAIVSAVSPRLTTPSGVQAAVKRPGEDPLVHDLVLRAESIWRRAAVGGPGAKAKFDEARELLNRALEIEPENVSALQCLALVINVEGVRGLAPFAESQRQSREILLRCLALRDDFAVLHVMYAVAALFWDDDFATGEREIRRAVELDPDQPEARRFESIVLKMAGRLDESIEVARAAVRLDPDGPTNYNSLGDVLLAAGRHDEAIEALRTAVRIDPQYDSARERLELACYRSGRLEDAYEARRVRAILKRDKSRAETLASETQALGYSEARRLDLERELVTLLDRAEREDPFAHVGSSRTLADQILITLTELGEWTRAMDWVERGFQCRPGRLRRVLTDFPFDRRGLAVDPRYARLLRSAGLEELL